MWGNATQLVEARKIMIETVVETLGGMGKREKTAFILEQVHTTSSEGAHVSPSTLGPSSGTGWTSPSSLARSAACIHVKRALRSPGPPTYAVWSKQQ